MKQEKSWQEVVARGWAQMLASFAVFAGVMLVAMFMSFDTLGVSSGSAALMALATIGLLVSNVRIIVVGTARAGSNKLLCFLLLLLAPFAAIGLLILLLTR